MLAACGSDPNQNGVLGPLAQSAGGLLGRTPAAGPTAAQIRNRITPEVRAQFGNAPLKIATLEEKNLASVLIERARNRDQITYFTPDGISMTYRSGVLVGTRGLGFDLMDADVAEVLSGIRNRSDGAIRIHRYLNGEEQVVLRSFICDYAGGGTVTETCYSDGLQMTNTYTMSGGHITSSRQWISPEQGYIRLEPAS
jgi:hypothetical protein